MLKLDYDAAHRFVEGYPGARWDGWTIVLWKRDEAGFNDRRGLRQDGQWGIARRVDPDSNGLWKFRV